MTRKRRPTVALVLAALLGVTVVVACEAPPERPDALVSIRAFTDALSAGDAALASSYTDQPTRARADLEAVFSALNQDGAEFVVQAMTVGTSAAGASATFTLGAVWHLGDSAYGAREWAFSTSGKAVRTATGWQIEWRPDVVIPGMQDGQQVRFRPQPPDPPEIRDRSGQTVMAQQTLKAVTVDPARVRSTGSAATDLAALLGPVDHDITRSSILDAISSGRGNPVVIVTLREEEYEPLASRLAEVQGVTVQDEPRLVTATAALNSPVFPVLRESWEERQEDSAGWTVELVAEDGSATMLASEPGIPLHDVTTELDLNVQLAAQNAIRNVSAPAAVVALQPSSGAVLAVAQNAAADALGPVALTGEFAPGSVFQAVTALAALDDGLVHLDDLVSCPDGAHADAVPVPVEAPEFREDEQRSEEVPFSGAFAHSCDAAIEDLALRLPDDALHNMALRLGVGLRIDSPGLIAATGSVPITGSRAERIEAAHGQGDLRVTPFGMALAAATIARGTVPEPFLLGRGNGPARDVAAPTTTAAEAEEVEALDLGVTNDLKRMMREAVTAGAAAKLADLPGLIGAAGTAATAGEGDVNDEWFIGIDGDLAFAVLVRQAANAHEAVDSAERFLRPLQE